MGESHPERAVDPVCGMAVDVATAEAAGLTVAYGGRVYAFCRTGCRRAFEGEPDAYAAKAKAVTAATDHGAPGTPGTSGVAGVSGAPSPSQDAAGADQPVIDEGMRRWYESCPCCLSDAYPEIKAALDAERAVAAQPAAGPGICEVAEAAIPDVSG